MPNCAPASLGYRLFSCFINTDMDIFTAPDQGIKVVGVIAVVIISGGLDGHTIIIFHL
jgi:hypothetical protein